jgi:transposase
LTKLEKKFLDKTWEEVRDKVKVKLLREDGELYVLVESADRVNKERSMRRRRLKKLWARLSQLQVQNNTRDQLLLKIGAAKKEAGRAYSLVNINLPEPKGIVNKETFTFSLNKAKLRKVMKKEWKYLLRSNLTVTDPGLLWKQYMLLGEVEQTFKEEKGDLLIRPIHHQKDERIEAHIFVAFQAYCLNVTLKQRLKVLAPGLTPRAVIEKFKKIQMLDVHLPTTDGKQLVLTRYTQPEKEHKMLLNQMKLNLPKQPLPKIISNGEAIVK